MKILKGLMSPQKRKWLYGITISVLILVGGYGFITDEMLPLWISLAGSVFGLATAVSNVNPDEEVKESTLDNIEL